jgi:hypothetical protein
VLSVSQMILHFSSIETLRVFSSTDAGVVILQGVLQNMLSEDLVRLQ